MSKFTDFYPDPPDRKPADKLRWLAELRLQQWKREALQHQAGAGERFGADLLALVRPWVRDDSVAEYLAFMWQVALVQDTHVQLMYPLADKGVRFKPGRPKDTIGPVRGWIRKYVAKHPDTKPAQAWAAFAKRPPKGCTPHHTHVWVEGQGSTSRAWFGSVVGQEKARLQGLASP